MGSFQYEWYTVRVRDYTGQGVMEFKAKSKDSAIKQIKKHVERSMSEENLSLYRLNSFSNNGKKRIMPIIEVYWETLELDRIGYQRLY